jgi:hypothetical protein
MEKNSEADFGVDTPSRPRLQRLILVHASV